MEKVYPLVRTNRADCELSWKGFGLESKIAAKVRPYSYLYFHFRPQAWDGSSLMMEQNSEE